MTPTIYIEVRDGVVVNVRAPVRLGVVIVDHDAGKVDARHRGYNEKKLREASSRSPVEITP